MNNSMAYEAGVFHPQPKITEDREQKNFHSKEMCENLRTRYNKPQTDTSAAKVLVVGTTSDYIDWLRRAAPGRFIFLTDPCNRDQAVEAAPSAPEEILCVLEDYDLAAQILEKHLQHWGLSVDGVTSFDCESMELAAFLAEKLSLPYTSVASIRLCRDKFATKNIWQKNGVRCPRHRLVQSADAVRDFMQDIGGPCVLKPLSASGSELVFRCSTLKDCDKFTKLMLDGLAAREAIRLYDNATSWFIAEEYIDGEEFSCDFTIRDNQLDILRLAQKIKLKGNYFGTIHGYRLSDWETAHISQEILAELLLHGADALGINNAICMVDFIVTDGMISLLEITPRPGGDCIPFLLSKATGFDILRYATDFARQDTNNEIPLNMPPCEMIALRLHAGSSGEIIRMDSDKLRQDERVHEINLIRKIGHQITMPPVDYESWYLGHLLFQPHPDIPIEQQCNEVRRMLDLEIEHAST